MMKRLTITLALLFAFFCGFSQFDAITLNAKKSTGKIQRNDYEKLEMTFSYASINSFDVKTVRGEFSEISIPGAYYTGELGMPKLPATKKLIAVPFGAKVSVKVTNFDKEIYNLKDYGIKNKIMPVQPSISKSQDVEDVPFEYKPEAYAKNAFSDHELATVEVLGTMRGVRIARLEVAPVRYNPSTDEITVYNNIQVEVTFTDSDIAKTKEMEASTYSPYFDIVYKKLFNWKGYRDSDDGYPEHPDLTKYPIKYLVVSDRMFEETLQPFLEWKIKQGFELIVAYTDEIGTSYNEIESWVHDQYENADGVKPSFVLLVGDSPQIPMKYGSSSNKFTDLYYGSVDGDYFPEMYYGRFSAVNVEQLQAQIDKTLYYEQYQFENPDFLDRVTLIAGADGTWNPRVGQPAVHYGVDNYFNAANGYSTVNPYYNTYAGCYETVNEGVGFINYTAHCNVTVWGDPSLTIYDVNNFTNNNMYPLAMGNCCMSNDIGAGVECIGEAWVRKANGGAVAYIGSAPNSYWFEDFYFAVGAFPIQGTNDGYVPTTDETTMGTYDAMFVGDYACVDALVFVGNLAVTEVHIQNYPNHASPLYYWQAYMCNGDPSLMLYNTQGTDNNVDHLPTLPIGLDTFEIYADPKSYVGISKDGVLLGAAIVGDEGVVEVPITPVLDGGDVDIVVTGRQKIPYITQIPAAALEGAYIVLKEYTVNDENENNNQIIESGENFSIDAVVKNVGVETAVGVNAVLLGEDPYFQVEAPNNANIGSINPNQTVTVNDAFSFVVANNVPDQHKVEFQMEFKDNSNETWVSKLRMTANAPVLDLGNIVVVPNDDNNSNHLEPGMSNDLNLSILNIGHADAVDVTATLVCLNDLVTIPENELNIDNITPENEIIGTYNLTVSEEAQEGSAALFQLTLTTGGYTFVKDFSLVIGLQFEDFEAGEFNPNYGWAFEGNNEWTVTDAQAYEGEYSAQSGPISHNQKSVMKVEGNVHLPSTISFYYKVSSEANYDKLKFYIDNIEKGAWSGLVNWSLAEYDIQPGEHSFKWEYKKDVSASANEDKAWVDNITFPSMTFIGGPLTVSIVATPNNICQGEDVSLFAHVGGGGNEYTYSWSPAELVEDPTAQSTIAHIDETTTFTVEVSDGNDTVQAIKTVTVNPKPQTPEIYVVAINTLKTKEEAESYQWFDGNDDPITGATEQTLEITQSGIYYAIIGDENGCLSDPSNKLDATIDVNELKEDVANIYPNPFSQETTIEYVLKQAGNLNIVLINSLGETLQVLENSKNKDAGTHIYTIKGSNLDEGVYFIVFRQDNMQFTKKLVLVK